MISCAEEFTYEDVKKRLQSLNVEISSCGALFPEHSGDFPNKYYLYVRKIEHRSSPSNTLFNKTKIYSYKIKPLNVEELTSGDILLSLYDDDEGIRYIFDLNTGKIETLREGDPTLILFNPKEQIIEMKEIEPSVVSKKETTDTKVSSSIVDNKGGIAFNALPIQTEAVASSALGSFPATGVFKGDLDAEWAQIQQVFNAGIRPSIQRLNEYTQAASASPLAEEKIDAVRGLLADMLRRDEESEKLKPAEEALKQLLSLLESDRPTQELQLALSRNEKT